LLFFSVSFYSPTAKALSPPFFLASFAHTPCRLYLRRKILKEREQATERGAASPAAVPAGTAPDSRAASDEFQKPEDRHSADVDTTVEHSGPSTGASSEDETTRAKKEASRAAAAAEGGADISSDSPATSDEHGGATRGERMARAVRKNALFRTLTKGVRHDIHKAIEKDKW
jgi:hypothetical protein